MNTPPLDLVPFRLPAAVVRRTFGLHAAVIVVALVTVHVAGKQQAVAALGGAASLAALVLVVGYAATARRVWFTLSPVGISTTSYVGRKTELPWSAALKVAAARRSGYKGQAVVEQDAGLLRSSTSAIFVPNAIASSPEFASTVAAWAPQGHPLRTIAEHAA